MEIFSVLGVMEQEGVEVISCLPPSKAKTDSSPSPVLSFGMTVIDVIVVQS